MFLPSCKSSLIKYDEKYKCRDISSIIGLSLYAAVPKSCYNLLRLDIVPHQTCGNMEFFKCCVIFFKKKKVE